LEFSTFVVISFAIGVKRFLSCCLPMKTKDLICEKSLLLFNQNGINGVSYREIAKFVGISFGNLTYHYPNKDALVAHLIGAMIAEHRAISDTFLTQSQSLLESLLLAPTHTFAISCKYQFFFKDYAEIKRQHSALIKSIEAGNSMQKQKLLTIFEELKRQNLFRPEIPTEQICFLMELSGIVRTFFFMSLTEEQLSESILPSTRLQYIQTINAILPAYLTAEGVRQYEAFAKNLQK
jgi:AcrR family transcriptional regulator